jgi:hypothetical protein
MIRGEKHGAGRGERTLLKGELGFVVRFKVVQTQGHHQHLLHLHFFPGLEGYNCLTIKLAPNSAQTGAGVPLTGGVFGFAVSAAVSS